MDDADRRLLEEQRALQIRYHFRDGMSDSEFEASALQLAREVNDLLAKLDEAQPNGG
jgi:hypothetical protein